jgi:hypothetical protein
MKSAAFSGDCPVKATGSSCRNTAEKVSREGGPLSSRSIGFLASANSAMSVHDLAPHSVAATAMNRI